MTHPGSPGGPYRKILNYPRFSLCYKVAFAASGRKWPDLWGPPPGPRHGPFLWHSGCLCHPQRLTLQCTLTPAVHPSEGPPAEDPCPRQNGASGARPGQGGRTAVTAARSGVSFLHRASLGPRQTCDRPRPTPGSRDRAVPPHELRGPAPRFCPQLRPVQRAGPDRQRVPRMPTRPAPSRPLGLLGGDWAEGRVPR